MSNFHPTSHTVIKQNQPKISNPPDKTNTKNKSIQVTMYIYMKITKIPIKNERTMGSLKAHT